MRFMYTTKKGFTFMETLVATLVTTVMSAVVITTIVCLMNFFFGEVANAELKRKAHQSLSTIIQDLRTAEPDGANGIDVLNDGDNNKITARLAGGWDANGFLVYSTDDTHYWLDGDELVKDNIDTGERRVLCNLASRFNCTEYAEGHYSMTLILTKDTVLKTITYTATENFGVRND